MWLLGDFFDFIIQILSFWMVWPIIAIIVGIAATVLTIANDGKPSTKRNLGISWTCFVGFSITNILTGGLFPGAAILFVFELPINFLIPEGSDPLNWSTFILCGLFWPFGIPFSQLISIWIRIISPGTTESPRRNMPAFATSLLVWSIALSWGIIYIAS